MGILSAIKTPKLTTLVKSAEGDIVEAAIYKGGKFTRGVMLGEKCLGSGYCCVLNAKILGDAYPDYYKGKSYIGVNSLDATRGYKGVGTAIIREFVRISKKMGLEGRLTLNATATKAAFGNPIPFYYKIGLRSIDDELNKNIAQHISDGGKTPLAKTSTTMFLPKENIESLLSKKVN